MSGRVAKVFSEVLGVDAVRITDDTSPDNTPQWDSMAAMNLVVAIEDEFDVRLSTAEIVSMRTVAVVKKVLATKGVVDA
ncbi:MAG TPA: acyl carrier protein [Stellaceae bacterium]|nr:acyl carrier protein [Stellaceae bacterium]